MVYMPCTNSRYMIRKTSFSTADGLHTSFKVVITTVEEVSYSDEAWFHLSRYVNSQNIRIWSAEE
jgi:hypothetical protein